VIAGAVTETAVGFVTALLFLVLAISSAETRAAARKTARVLRANILKVDITRCDGRSE
jgi:hypothetical protein